MKLLLKVAAVLSVLTLSACVVVPWPGYYHRAYGYQSAPPPPYGGDYGPRRPRW
jgi:hypothetical protein